MYSAKDYLAALEPPRFEAPDGKVYVGRVVSQEQYLPLQAKLLAFGERKDLASFTALARAVCDLLFPRPWWKVWERSVYSHVMALPSYTQRMRAVLDFLACQDRVMREDASPAADTAPAATPTAG